MAADLPSWRARLWAGLVAVPVVVGAAWAAGVLAGGVVAVVAVQVIATEPAVPRLGRALRAAMLRAWAVTGAAARRAGGVLRVLLVRVVPAGIGMLAVLVALDFAAGGAWNRLTGADDPPPARPLDLAVEARPAATDPRLDTPAMADSPWAERYFQELEAIPYTYLPIVGPRDGEVRGRYINAGGGIRRSYQPPGTAGDDGTTVWFFGGSTLWGEGQRDLHTIPSEVARLAEADGVALRAVNYGIRGYTAFQEFLVFEQELARRNPPDLAVFYHGANEVYTLLEAPANLGPQPSMFQIEALTEAFAQAPPLPQHPVIEPSLARDYFETSLLQKALRVARGLVESPAGAGGPAGAPGVEPVFGDDIERALTEATQIYHRSVALIEHAGDEHGVPTVLFWQPGSRPGANDVYEALGDRLRGAHLDVSDALVDAPGPVYIDALHTNELGARLAADAIWSHLRPAVGDVGG